MAIVRHFILSKIDCFQLPARPSMECVTYDHKAQRAQDLIFGVGSTNWVFDERIFGLVTAFSSIQSRHQLFQVFLSECNGWQWQNNTPLYGSVGIRQDDAVTTPADRFSLLEADRVFNAAPCPFAWTSLRARGARTAKPSPLKPMGKRACASALWLTRRRRKRS